ncbi:Na+/H+ antiporter subunit E [Clostridium aestuarii]|uniref:Na+/H+ antiporter subunit E n=1 Tax=Clostridium aestuarii TaxID=338193 RepID=A0ABT4D3K8_9CLOT|nr:Na+/H+ antiporter subunit E [Clostridium aestuarii]MCY6485227.1 Na+/H+ antiporter subunit E [Clostridium aestuarii]
MIFKVIILYVLFWTVLSGNVNIETVTIGVLLSLMIAIFNTELIHSSDIKGKFSISKLKYWIVYIGVLIKEIFIANFKVAKIVLSTKMEISPQIVKFKTKLKSEFCRTILANSITLTPGTITVLMENDELVVHCLKSEYKEDLLDSKFEKILLKVEG